MSEQKSYSVFRETTTVEGFWMPHEESRLTFAGKAGSRSEAEEIARKVASDGDVAYVHENDGNVSTLVSMFNGER